MKCWWLFFHKWSKWEKKVYKVCNAPHPLFDNSAEVTGPPTDDKSWHRELRQERRCSDCGRIQVERL